jgi:hypothetical protein
VKDFFQSRNAVIKLLKKVFRDKKPLFQLEKELSTLPPLYYRIFLGVLEKRFLLEKILNTFLTEKKKVKGNFKYHLLISLYSVLFLKETDISKNIGFSMQFAKKYFGSALSRLNYKFLKQAPEMYKKIMSQAEGLSDVEKLELFYSVPSWMGTQILKSFSYSLIAEKLSSELPVWGVLLKGERRKFKEFCQQGNLEISFPFASNIFKLNSSFCSNVTSNTETPPSPPLLPFLSAPAGAAMVIFTLTSFSSAHIL